MRCIMLLALEANERSNLTVDLTYFGSQKWIEMFIYDGKEPNSPLMFQEKFELDNIQEGEKITSMLNSIVNTGVF